MANAVVSSIPQAKMTVTKRIALPLIGRAVPRIFPPPKPTG
jgi:hypothetical protein